MVRIVLKGERLDKPTYSKVDTDIESGAGGTVVVVHHDIFGKNMVQKTVSLMGMGDSYASSEPGRLESFDHPNIIDIAEAQWTPDEPERLKLVTFVSPFYEGRCIHTAMVEGHEFGVGGTIKVVEGILSALVYLHEDRGLLHRDIKPPNVMLDAARAHAYVGDLGSAAELDPQTGTTQAHGGTDIYRAPEHVGETYDVRSDLYSVGSVMLEMLNGRHEYENLDWTKLAKRVDEGKRAFVDRVYRPAPWVPAPLAAVLRKLVATDPADRYASASQARRAL